MTPMSAEGVFAVFGPVFISFALVATRIAAMVITAPIFSGFAVPGTVRAGIVGTLAVVVMFVTGPVPGVAQLGILELMAAAVLEAVVGGLIGLSVMVVLAALNFTGELIGIQMGFTIANVVDPSTAQQVGVLSQVLNLLGLMLFLVNDGHLFVLKALFDSFQQVPLGGAMPQPGPLIDDLIRLGGGLFTIGLRIALPVVCVVLLINVGLATIARTVPQVNIFVIGFLLTISMGLLVLGIALPTTAVMFELLVERAISAAILMVGRF